MNVPSVSVRFGLILEAYCHGSVHHLPALIRQVECLNKLQFLSEQVRLKPNKEKQRAALHEMLAESFAIEAFKNIISPLDPSFHCRSLK
jgi:phosphatidylinositol-4,5-bisphosphate 3-kinase